MAEAIIPALEWSSHSTTEHSFAERRGTAALIEGLNQAIAFHRFDPAHYVEDFPDILGGLALGDPADTERILLLALAKRAHGLPTIYLPENKAIEEMTAEFENRLGRKVLVEVSEWHSDVPRKNIGAAAYLYEIGDKLYYRMTLELLTSLEDVMPLIKYECRFWEAIQSGMPVPEAYHAALAEDASLEGLLDKVLGMIWENRKDLEFTTKNYVSGALLRADHPKGKTQSDLAHFEYGPLGHAMYELRLHIQKSGAWRLQEDAWLTAEMVKWRVTSGRKDAYSEEVQALFKNDPYKRTLTAEQIYAQVKRIRNKIFVSAENSFDHQLQARLLHEADRIAIVLQSLKRKSDFKRAVLAALLIEHGNNIYGQHLGKAAVEFSLPILEKWIAASPLDDDLEEFAARLSEPTTYVHVVGSVNSLFAELLVFGEWLLAKWGKKGNVVILVKEKRFGSDATSSDIDHLLGKQQLRSLRHNPRFHVVPVSFDAPGFDFRFVSGEAADSLRKVQRGEAVLGLSGEHNWPAGNEVQLGHYRLSVVRAHYTLETSGRTWNPHTQQNPPTIVVRVPAGVAPTDNWRRHIQL